MTKTKDIILHIDDGDFSIKSGKGMTSIYFKKQEKLVLYTTELDKIIKMLEECKKEWEVI